MGKPSLRNFWAARRNGAMDRSLPGEALPWNQRHPFLWAIIFSMMSVALLVLARGMLHVMALKPAIFCIVVALGLLVVEVILFVPPLLRNALRNASFRFQITGTGGAFIAFLVLIGLAAANTGNNLLYILVAFFISAISASGVLSRTSLAKVSVGVDFQDAIFAGESTACRLRVTNRKRFSSSLSLTVEGCLVNSTWSHILKSEKESSNTQKRGVPTQIPPVLRIASYFPFLRAGMSDERQFHVSFPRRGVYHIDEVTVSTTFPFGFFRKGRRMSTSGDLIVYPALLEPEELISRLERCHETLPLLRRGMGTELYTLREYRAGEDVRFIHWKATARTGRPIMKEFALEAQDRFLLLFDEMVPGVPETYLEAFESATSMLATLVVEMHGRGKPVRILASHRGGGCDTRDDLACALEVLARSEPVDSMAQSGHPFLQSAWLTGLDLEPYRGGVILCSFRGVGSLPVLSPFLDGYVDLGGQG